MKSNFKINYRLRYNSLLACLGTLLISTAACTDIQGGKKTNFNGDGSNGNVKLDPSKAAVTVAVDTKPMPGYPNGSIPSLSLTFSGSDFTEVFRCGANFELKYGNGIQKLKDVPKSDPSYLERAKDAFGRMRSNASDCVKLGVGNSLNLVHDYGAQTGDFYYIVNPCVTEEKSITNRQECSYQLAITEPIQYTNTRAQAEVDILNTFLKAEGELYAHFKEMEALNVAIVSIQTSCVLDEAERQLVEKRSKAILGLITSVATTVINGLAPGVGTALGAVVGALGELKSAGAQPNVGSACPEAVTKEKRYQELQGRVTEIATSVIEARKELHSLDSAYHDVTKELNALK
ncbi:MAG: hypothetical protein RJB13_2530, partial [Pseudomonadota bacterium]